MKEVTYNSSLLKDSWNSNETVKPNNFNELSGAVKNVIANANDLAHNYLQQGKQYVVGDIVYSKNLNKGRYLLCTQGGTTGDSEPQLINKNVGETVTHGSVVWTVQNIRTTALDSYPVGSIYMSVNSTSPADLFGGTWEAMPAGRVLLAQGTSEWGVEYQAGSTGGEHEHQLSVGELPEHEHDVTCSNNGLHQHKIDIYNDEGRDAPYVAGAAGGIKGSPSTSETGNHSHTISINKTGGNFAHNNMQPYISVYCWRRTA